MVFARDGRMICGVIAAHELARALVSYYNGDAKQTRACAAGPVATGDLA